MREETGYIGSFLLHATIVGVGFLFASMTPEVREIEDQDPLLLEVWKGDGSERAPGIPGAERGVAEGVVTGDKSKTGLGGATFTPLKKLNADKFIKEMNDNQAKAAAEAEKAAKSAKAEAESEKKSSKKETLADFEKSTGKHSKSGKTSSSGSASGTSSVGSKNGKAGIAGANVGESGTGRGSGRDGFGRAGGKGKNGGDGGSGNAEKLFVGAVKGAFADLYVPMFREQGGEMSAAKDQGVIKITVSESGLISFDWVRKPSDPVVVRLVESAINKMRPMPPPKGEALAFSISVSGAVESE